ncbi:hypothetical protein OG875_17405 [Streptomyces sp. NBC_01498]|uniref:hypothetical protein n=1 Tax=Streptomyces sp. NBC_01498 TaxID=2975870 RepID=UPI002E7BE011|nr:hypothetical protein [Streptomyces sp. NBC_01498]WTL29062.1 hypothetical protein OG875_17405 [Streptomyces sp. NBC_01498]
MDVKANAGRSNIGLSNTGVRIAAYAAVLVAVFGVAYGVGAAMDPVVAEKPPPAVHEEERHGGEGEGGGDGRGEAAPTAH